MKVTTLMLFMARTANDRKRWSIGLSRGKLSLTGGHRMNIRLTAVFQKVPEGYIGFVEELPGANTQGATLQEARANLREAIELVLEANRKLAEESLKGREVIREVLPGA